MRPLTEQVAVDGGSLTVHRLTQAPDGAPVVVALHSISSNALAWVPVARRLDGLVHVLAPDMRGRAESSHLRSAGLADHVADVHALLVHFGVTRPVLAGHDMGAFVAALAAATHPEDVGAVVLVDGGLAFPSPGSLFNAIADVDEVLHSIIGPAMDRLSMTFDDDAAYLAHWGVHPTLGPHLDGASGPALAAYLLHDLAGPRGQMRSTSSLESVRADWADLVSDPATLSAVHTMQCSATLLYAGRGPLGQPEGLYTADRIAAAHLPPDVTVRGLDSDHYGVLLDPASVAAVADALTVSAGPPSGRGIHTSVR
ncbi:alpha/beta hydrolase [Pedococcus sp. KACC 23699]|uniref:Alpha/beta hydrolase n=1 Tax=Pedococcus sp. KACC 23699 TaxID=3149228 RepID=A0AAU7JT66_9MICO